MTNRLMTAELAEQLKDFPLYSQDGKQKDATCVCVFEIGLIRWYVLEGQPEGDDFTLFSIAVGMAETEYGYASVKERYHCRWLPVWIGHVEYKTSTRLQALPTCQDTGQAATGLPVKALRRTVMKRLCKRE